jgi:hypothetical protein
VDAGRADIVGEFQRVVNMPADSLSDWLRTSDSRAVGQKADGQTESVGHQSGLRIVRLLKKKADTLSDGDLKHMRKVVGYVHRHLAQRPRGGRDDIRHSRWRYSLMNWGHDPLRDT